MKTRQWVILPASLIILAGCAASPVSLPDFTVAERSPEPITLPTVYPILCEIPDWDTSCWQSFAAFEEIAVNNAELATLNAEIAQDSEAAYDSILSAARQQQQISQIREEQLAIVRREAFLDIWIRNAIIAVGILVSL